MIRPLCWLLSGVLILLLTGCGHSPEQFILPDQVTDFSTLYAANCAGCHGKDGRYGAARPLHDRLYLALIGKQKLREVIAQGVPNTAMPPFAQKAGGTLVDKQIDVLADQMMLHWSAPGLSGEETLLLPPYSAPLNGGDARQGRAPFRRYCASCHGDDGTGGAWLKGGSAVDPAYLALASDQSLRTTVIAGRSDQGIPNWRGYIPGHAMSPQEISDVVAWLAAQRPSLAGKGPAAALDFVSNRDKWPRRARLSSAGGYLEDGLAKGE